MRLALHDQRPPRSSGRTLEAYVAESLADVHAAEARLAELEARMAGGAHDEDTLRDYASAQAALEAAGGYEWRTRIESILRGLGFAHADLGRPLDTFSGGELTRASLARALAARPDVLLLDEPTNHLDLVSLEWLEREIQSLDASVLLVSHDRWFLESVANGVLELELGRSKVYAMGYSAYRREKAQQLETQAGAWERQQEEIQRLERFVAKFKAGTRARQAKSVEKRLGRMERVEKPRGEKSLAFGFPKTTRPGRIVLEADDLRLVAGEKLLVEDASFALERGARVAVIGPNGSGKTTLIETLLGRRRPAGGRIKLGHNAEVAYFSQHVEELPENATVLEAMCLGTALNQGQARNLLGRFLFGGDTVERRVGVLSGGERRRLSLARLVASGANTLVLDEPTNHLDIESREALEEALDAFDGTILFVSHDRALIDAVADETLSVERHRLVQRPGDYNDYLAATAAQPPRRGAREAEAEAAAAPGRDAPGAAAAIVGAPAPAAPRAPHPRARGAHRDAGGGGRRARARPGRSGRRDRPRSRLPRRRPAPREAGGAQLAHARVGGGEHDSRGSGVVSAECATWWTGCRTPSAAWPSRCRRSCGWRSSSRRPRWRRRPSRPPSGAPSSSPPACCCSSPSSAC